MSRQHARFLEVPTVAGLDEWVREAGVLLLADQRQIPHLQKLDLICLPDCQRNGIPCLKKGKVAKVSRHGNFEMWNVFFWPMRALGWCSFPKTILLSVVFEDPSLCHCLGKNLPLTNGFIGSDKQFSKTDTVVLSFTDLKFASCR